MEESEKSEKGSLNKKNVDESWKKNFGTTRKNLESINKNGLKVTISIRPSFLNSGLEGYNNLEDENFLLEFKYHVCSQMLHRQVGNI